MKIAATALALAVAAVFATACDRPKTAYNNSGASATTASTTATTAPVSTPAASDTATATTTASPGTSATISGDATGAVSETVTTGKIKAAIAADSGLKDSDISVSTNNGVVTLSGTVKSQDQVAIATNLAQKQDGVQKVESNIAVK
jgi:hyperosmotically inducible protein